MLYCIYNTILLILSAGESRSEASNATGELLQFLGVLSNFLFYFLCQVSLGAKLRMRRAKLLQIWAFAICKVQKF